MTLNTGAGYAIDATLVRPLGCNLVAGTNRAGSDVSTAVPALAEIVSIHMPLQGPMLSTYVHVLHRPTRICPFLIRTYLPSIHHRKPDIRG